MRATSTASLFAATILAAAAAAQTPDNLIALTRNTPLLYQRDHQSCTMLPFCNPPLPPAPAIPFAGGTAWDPIRNAAVVSNGFLIAEVDPNTCAVICPPSPAPTVSPNAVVTGLEFVETLNQIWMLDSFGALTQMQYACPPVVLSVCNTGLPLTATNATGGLAVDEVHRIVFYSYTDWVANTNVIHIASMANPCLTTQIVVPFSCLTTTPLRGITGLAADGCRSQLYITDGVQTICWRYAVAAGPVVAFGPQTCCTLPMPAADPMIGLAVRSGRETSIGSPCANGVCPPCPMIHSLTNSPNLGNAFFQLQLDQAPQNSLIYCAIGLGPCNAVGPVPAPFCGPLLIGPSALTLGPVITPPGAPCSAFVGFTLPLPMNPTFCGIVASSQCLGVCVAGGALGFSMSNCISWELQSN